MTVKDMGRRRTGVLAVLAGMGLVLGCASAACAVPAGDGPNDPHTVYREPSYQASTATVGPDGKITVEVASIASKVQVRYRKAGHQRVRTKKLVHGRAVWVLPAGSVKVATRAMKDLDYRATAWRLTSQPYEKLSVPQGTSYWIREEPQLATAFGQVMQVSGDRMQVAGPGTCEAGRITGMLWTSKSNNFGEAIARYVSVSMLYQRGGLIYQQDPESDELMGEVPIGWRQVSYEEADQATSPGGRWDPESWLAQCQFADPAWG